MYDAVFVCDGSVCVCDVVCACDVLVSDVVGVSFLNMHVSHE